MHLHKETGRIALIGSPPGFFITSLQFPQQKQQIRTHDQSAKGSDYIVLSRCDKKDTRLHALTKFETEKISLQMAMSIIWCR